MSLKTLRSALAGCCALMITITLATGSAVAQPTSTKSTSTRGATTETKLMEGTVLAVDGNNLVVRMSTGELRHIVASDSQRALIDGREVVAKDLQVGTKLKATVTTTTTSLLDRTVTVGSGQVWYVAPPSVILTLPNGENRQYKVSDDYKFTVAGQPATVFDLRKGMRVSAQKITEEPRTVVTANTVVTGELPPPVQTAASSPAPSAAPVPKAAPEPVRSTEPVPAPPRVVEPAPAPAPEPAAAKSLAAAKSPPAAKPPATAERAAAAPAPAAEPVPAPAEPAQTGSTLLWVGLIIVLLSACYLGFRALKRAR